MNTKKNAETLKDLRQILETTAKIVGPPAQVALICGEAGGDEPGCPEFAELRAMLDERGEFRVETIALQDFNSGNAQRFTSIARSSEIVIVNFGREDLIEDTICAWMIDWASNRLQPDGLLVHFSPAHGNLEARGILEQFAALLSQLGGFTLVHHQVGKGSGLKSEEEMIRNGERHPAPKDMLELIKTSRVKLMATGAGSRRN